MEAELCRGIPIFAAIITLVGLFILLVVTVLLVWAYCRIFSKAGYCWALGLLILVPIGNVVVAFVLAFADWPICKELRQLRQKQGSITG